MGNGAQSAIEDQIKGAGTNMITVNAGNFTSGGVRQGSGAASSLTVEDARRDPQRDRRRRSTSRRASTARAQVVAGNQNWSTRDPGHGRGSAVDSRLGAAGRVVLHRAGRPQRREGRRARLDRQHAAVRRRTPTRSGQIIRIGKQPFKVDRRHGVERPGHGRGHGRSDPRAVHDGAEEAARHHAREQHHRVGRYRPTKPAPSPDQHRGRCCGRATGSRPDETTTS